MSGADAGLDALIRSWERSLRAANLSDATIKDYQAGMRALRRYLAQAQIAEDVTRIDHGVLEGYMAAQRAKGLKPHSLLSRYRQLRPFFRWLFEEGEIVVNPMARMRPPKLDDVDPPLMTADMVTALLRVCAGNDFGARRDAAIVRLLIDTGMRAGALAGLSIADVDLDEQQVMIHTKGRKTRTVPFGKKTAAALDRYLRVRARHLHAASTALWVGHRGVMHYHGIHALLQRRAEQAGLPPIHQHMFRHGFAHLWLESGGQEGDLMAIGGWTDRDVMGRYARLTKQQRARDAHRVLSPGDRL